MTYASVGATAPASLEWKPPSSFRVFEKTILLGYGEPIWECASTDTIQWKVKTRSGFNVETAKGDSAVTVSAGDDLWLVAKFGSFSIREPIRIVEVVKTTDRVGYSYGTRRGHPVSGEEAFIVHRSLDGTVLFTIRSLTRPGFGIWRVLFPLTLIAQRWYRQRYLRSLKV